MTWPDFVLIGAAKAGTTALQWYLAEHPDIFMSPMKETNFFAHELDDAGNALYGRPDLHRFPVTTAEQYEQLFGGAGGFSAVGEASALYLECPFAARKIKAHIPTARIVCGLRNPVDRAYSDYQMYLRTRGMRFDPTTALSEDAEWARPDSHWMQIGLYHQMLEPYFDVFDRDDIHIYLFDDLVASTPTVVEGVYRFLGVDSAFSPDFATPHNVGGMPKSTILERVVTSSTMQRVLQPVVPRRLADSVRRIRTANMAPVPALPDDLRSRLMEHFESDLRRTADLIERDLSLWL